MIAPSEMPQRLVSFATSVSARKEDLDVDLYWDWV